MNDTIPQLDVALRERFRFSQPTGKAAPMLALVDAELTS
jgi:hypothetical protein